MPYFTSKKADNPEIAGRASQIVYALCYAGFSDSLRASCTGQVKLPFYLARPRDSAIVANIQDRPCYSSYVQSWSFEIPAGTMVLFLTECAIVASVSNIYRFGRFRGRRFVKTERFPFVKRKA